MCDWQSSFVELMGSTALINFPELWVDNIHDYTWGE